MYTVISTTGDRTSDRRVETLQLSQRSISHTSDAILASHGNAWPINLNVSCKLHPYSLQRTQSPPGPCLPKRIGNTLPGQVNWPHNYHDELIWRHLCAVWTVDSVVEFRLCNLWLLVRSPLVEITVNIYESNRSARVPFMCQIDL